MIDRLRAGPVVKVGTTRLIPIARLLSWYKDWGAGGVMEPVAVVVVDAGRRIALDTQGRVAPVETWLASVPELAGLIAEAERG